MLSPLHEEGSGRARATRIAQGKGDVARYDLYYATELYTIQSTADNGRVSHLKKRSKSRMATESE